MLYLPKADPPGSRKFEHGNACFVHLVTRHSLSMPISSTMMFKAMIRLKISILFYCAKCICRWYSFEPHDVFHTSAHNQIPCLEQKYDEYCKPHLYYELRHEKTCIWHNYAKIEVHVTVQVISAFVFATNTQGQSYRFTYFM